MVSKANNAASMLSCVVEFVINIRVWNQSVYRKKMGHCNKMPAHLVGAADDERHGCVVTIRNRLLLVLARLAASFPCPFSFLPRCFPLLIFCLTTINISLVLVGICMREENDYCSSQCCYDMTAYDMIGYAMM